MNQLTKNSDNPKLRNLYYTGRHGQTDIAEQTTIKFAFNLDLGSPERREGYFTAAVTSSI